MKRILSAVSVFAIVGIALAFTPSKFGQGNLWIKDSQGNCFLVNCHTSNQQLGTCSTSSTYYTSETNCINNSSYSGTAYVAPN